jgi:vacuolar-type H+-ATPase subunit H
MAREDVLRAIKDAEIAATETLSNAKKERSTDSFSGQTKRI